MYEESLKMPLIVSWPGFIKPGTRNQNLVQNLDYAQTFLEMAGATIPDDMQGESLVPLLKGESPSDWRKSIYYHYYEYPSYHQVPRHNGIRTERYKLINFYEFGEWEFYDLKTDPDELHNLYGNPEKKELIEEVRNQLINLQKSYDDKTVLPTKPKAWQARMRRTTSVQTEADFPPRTK
jgi:arylsulfatase A-like enzyme